MKILISIDGNISAGKSFLMAKLKELNLEDVLFIPEPLDYWESLKTSDNKSLLELFYSDMHRWAYTFQNCALLSRHLLIENAIKNNPDKKIFITERSIETDNKIFAKMLHDDGILNSLEFNLYQHWFEMVKSKSTPVSGIIYVSTNPDLSLERLHIRNRSGEESVSIEYLKKLDNYHRDWLLNLEKDKTKICNVNSDEINKVLEFISSF